MYFHGLARQRKVLIGESSWIVYRPLRYICPRCRRTKTINIPSVKPKARITEECKEQIIKFEGDLRLGKVEGF